MDFSNISPNDIIKNPDAGVTMDYQYGDDKHFVINKWQDLPADLFNSIAETYPKVMDTPFNQSPAQMQNMIIMVLKTPDLLPQFISMLKEQKKLINNKGFSIPGAQTTPTIQTKLTKEKLESYSAFEMAQCIENNFHQDWLKMCDKRKTEYEEKDNEGLAAWWNKCSVPYAMVEKEKHHKFLKEFLDEKIKESGGEVLITNKKKSLSAEAGTETGLPKFIANPFAGEEEETTAHAAVINDFCSGTKAYDYYKGIWDSHEASNSLDKLNYTLQDIESLKVVHKAVPKALRKLLAGRNVLLTGPTGSGKSYAAKQIALLLQALVQFVLTFYDMVVGPNFTEFDYLGKAMPMADEEDGAGKLAIIRSPLMVGFIQGYSLCFVDEISAAQAEVNIALNGMLASRRQFDPASGETKQCGDHFYFLAADNTDLTGPTPDYPTRVQQDDAFISRFVGARIRVDYDINLEKKVMHPKVYKLMQKFRKLLINKKVKVELSTRLGANLTNDIKSGFFTYEEAIGDWLSELSIPVKEALGLNKDEDDVEIQEED